MAKARTLVGVDVHAAEVVAAILDAEAGELRFQRLGGETGPVVRLMGALAGPVRGGTDRLRARAGTRCRRRRICGRGTRQDSARSD